MAAKPEYADSIQPLTSPSVSSATPSGAKALRPGDQPLPTKGTALGIQDLVIADSLGVQAQLSHIHALSGADFKAICADMRQRKQVGIERYGTLLLPNNGRDPARDAYEEALDGLFYLKQAIVEEIEYPAAIVTTTSSSSMYSRYDQLVAAYNAQWKVVALLQLCRARI